MVLEAGGGEGEGEGGGRKLTSIRDLARTANWFVIQVAWRFARRSGSTLFIPYPGREEWSKLEGEGANEVGRATMMPRGSGGRSGSKKERNVCLTRDLPRTINYGGVEIIQDFVAVTCDANKSFVPITYARLNFRSRQIRRCASARRRESGKRGNSKVNTKRDLWLPFALP